MLKHGDENETTMEVLIWTEYKNQEMASSCEEFLNDVKIYEADKH